MAGESHEQPELSWVERGDTVLVDVMPRKSSSLTPRRHLLGLMTMPCEERRSKTDRKSWRCCSGVALAIRTSSI